MADDDLKILTPAGAHCLAAYGTWPTIFTKGLYKIERSNKLVDWRSSASGWALHGNQRRGAEGERV